MHYRFIVVIALLLSLPIFIQAIAASDKNGIDIKFSGISIGDSVTRFLEGATLYWDKEGEPNYYYIHSKIHFSGVTSIVHIATYSSSVSTGDIRITNSANEVIARLRKHGITFVSNEYYIEYRIGNIRYLLGLTNGKINVITETLVNDKKIVHMEQNLFGENPIQFHASSTSEM